MKYLTREEIAAVIAQAEEQQRECRIREAELSASNAWSEYECLRNRNIELRSDIVSALDFMKADEVDAAQAVLRRAIGR